MNALGTAQTAGPRVQLFILSRDRRAYCREAILSALSQDYQPLEIIVSDNSVHEDVAEMVLNEFPAVHLVRRIPNLPALDHFNQLIAEVVAPLMVMFHDDDVLHPQYVSRMVDQLKHHPEAAAVGCNAYIMRDDQLTQAKIMGDFSGTHLLTNPMELLEPYFSLGLIDPAPFPGYMYRSERIRGLKLDYSQGGKHSDVSFLCELLGRSPLLWTDECLFNYRLHGGNDSWHESIGQRLCLLRYAQSRTGLTKQSRLVKEYKFMYWRRWIKQNSSNSRATHGGSRGPSRRLVVARRFVMMWTIRLALTRMNFWRRAARRLVRRY